MKIDEFTINLTEKDGIYYSIINKTISYPKEGNNICFQIEDSSYWFQHRNNCIIEAIKSYSPKSTFFDIGGGNGFVSKALQEINIESVLIEPGIEGCINAKKRGLKKIICSTLQDSSLPNNSINAAGLFDVIEHIKDDENFLNDLYTYIKPDGCIFITVPSFNYLWSNDDNDAGHYRRYTLKSIKSILNKCGYEVIYSTYIFLLFPIPIYLFRSIPSKLLKNKKVKTNHENQHKIKNPLVRFFLNWIFQFEINNIRKNKSINFGSSCFVVAKKRS